MLNDTRRRWVPGLSIGVGLPLLLGSGPAAAAGASAGIVAISPWLGLAAALWAVLGASAVTVDAGGAGMAALGIATLASAGWAWRHQRGRGACMAARPRASAIAAAGQPMAIPAGLDSEQVLDAARGRFLRLQAAWDAADISALTSLTTPDMLEELLDVLSTRGEGASHTDVITLHAELRGLEELNAAYLASVEFSGLICESAGQGAVPFRELWMLACMKDGAPSWRLARHQSLF